MPRSTDRPHGSSAFHDNGHRSPSWLRLNSAALSGGGRAAVNVEVPLGGAGVMPTDGPAHGERGGALAMAESERILVIKLGALGDVILAMGPFKAIRDHHRGAHVTLLTAPPFADLARRSGYFDEVWVDRRAKPWHLGAWFALAKRLRGARFQRVYDLQHADRTLAYYWLMTRARQLEWSGIAPGCSHPHANPHRDAMHTLERQAEQLAMAGIAETPPADLDWLAADVEGFALPARYALLVPGGARHRLDKRWPAGAYREVAAWLSARAVAPVCIGAQAEREVLAEVAAAIPEAINLCGQTAFDQIASLARGAAVAVGNDTGPMHLIAAGGCPALVLYSAVSDPALTAPRGPHVTVLRKPDMAGLEVAAVIDALARHLPTA